ncbi:MAG: metallopeptidase family protein [Dermatophilaceae bacterium]
MEQPPAPHSGAPERGMRGRRDRHGRGRRGPLAWPPVPAMQSRRDRFDDLVREVAERARPWLGTRHGDVEFAVEDVPPDDPPAWEPRAATLGRVVGGGRVPRRIVVYRRPVEARAGSEAEVSALVRDVVTEQVALLLGVPPDEIVL